jgi:hypothetical protein
VLTSRATLLLYYLTECLLGHENKHGDLEINGLFKQRQNFSPAASVHVAEHSYFNINSLFFCFDPKGRIPGLKKRFLLFSKEPT